MPITIYAGQDDGASTFSTKRLKGHRLFCRKNDGAKAFLTKDEIAETFLSDLTFRRFLLLIFFGSIANIHHQSQHGVTFSGS